MTRQAKDLEPMEANNASVNSFRGQFARASRVALLALGTIGTNEITNMVWLAIGEALVTLERKGVDLLSSSRDEELLGRAVVSSRKWENIESISPRVRQTAALAELVGVDALLDVARSHRREQSAPSVEMRLIETLLGSFGDPNWPPWVRTIQQYGFAYGVAAGLAFAEMVGTRAELFDQADYGSAQRESFAAARKKGQFVKSRNSQRATSEIRRLFKKEKDVSGTSQRAFARKHAQVTKFGGALWSESKIRESLAGL